MGQELTKQVFAGVVDWNQSANFGRGEYQAQFMTVHPGREDEAESIRKAWSSAAIKGTRLRDGVKGFNREQLEQRLAQVEQIPEDKRLPHVVEGLKQLHLGLDAVVRHYEAAPNGPAAPVQTSKAKVGLTA